MFQVWDMESKPTLQFTIHTSTSIGHIKWRPGRRFHIASCALVVDCNVNVWDIRRPYIPFAAFDQHKDVATGVAWRGSPHVFLSTSRDCSLVQNVFSDAKRPADAANPQGISISGTYAKMAWTMFQCHLHWTIRFRVYLSITAQITNLLCDVCLFLSHLSGV